jgi:hypothetical protein
MTTEYEKLYGELFPPEAAQPPRQHDRPAISLDDQDVLNRMFRAANGARAQALFNGDTSAYDGDDSRADSALCFHLAFWSGGDVDQIDRLFRQSSLYREKWERDDYRERTMDNAIRLVQNHYSGHTNGHSAPHPRHEPGLNSSNSFISSTDENEWPEPPTAAFHGLPGMIVDILDPYTEADRVAVLVQILSAFGNAIGSGPHSMVAATRHALKFWPILIGDTSMARKGDSWNASSFPLSFADQEWSQWRVRDGGLSSGEGLIWEVRNPVEKKEPVKRDGKVVEYQDVIVDPGVADKRLMVVETEFARVLQVMERKGNTLSAIIRQAWDGDRLRTMTKFSPAISIGAHISIVGHITKDEMERTLLESEMANGFGNRFCYFCVRRSKLLPEPEVLDASIVANVADLIAERVEMAKYVGLIRRNDRASKVWRGLYESLTAPQPGMVGYLLARRRRARHAPLSALCPPRWPRHGRYSPPRSCLRPLELRRTQHEVCLR